MDDLISRQDAIDALMEILDRPEHAEFLYGDEIHRALMALPSAQPEIIRCKDCKFYSPNNGGECTRCGGLQYLITEDEYCSKGEQK